MTDAEAKEKKESEKIANLVESYFNGLSHVEKEAFAKQMVKAQKIADAILRNKS